MDLRLTLTTVTGEPRGVGGCLASLLIPLLWALSSQGLAYLVWSPALLRK